MAESMLVYIAAQGTTRLDDLDKEPYYVVTAMSMPQSVWKSNFKVWQDLKKNLKEEYALPLSETIDVRGLIENKGPMASFGYDRTKRQIILQRVAHYIGKMEKELFTTVLIDKTKISGDRYEVRNNALTYLLQRVENLSQDLDGCLYEVICTPNLLSSARTLARKMRAYNPIPLREGGYKNLPIENMIEDVSTRKIDAAFIQCTEYTAYFMEAAFYLDVIKQGILPSGRRTLDTETVRGILDEYEAGRLVNYNAASVRSKWGIVFYPKTK